MDEFNDFWDVLPEKNPIAEQVCVTFLSFPYQISLITFLIVNNFLFRFIFFSELQRLREFLSLANGEDDELQDEEADFEVEVLATEAIQFLRFQLNDYPYPTFQLVNVLKRVRDEVIFDDLEYYTLLNTVENIGESKEFDKLLSMLANFRLGEEKYDTFCRVILPAVAEKVSTGVLGIRKVTLALIARDTDNHDLLRRFLQLCTATTTVATDSW